jgi:type I restriction enzyme M protein
MNKIIAKLAEANDLKGVIDVADFNDADKLGKGKEMVDRLTNLVSIFDSSDLDFSGNRAEGPGRREGSCRSGKVASQSSRE